MTYAEYLQDMYIKNPEEQQILSNDGAYIIFYEKCGDVVIIHQSDENTDNFVCVELEHLKQIINHN
jgi:hypothetical protein